VVGEDLEEEGLELRVGLVHLVDQEQRRHVGEDGLEHRAREEEALVEEDVALGVEPVGGLGQRAGPGERLADALLQHLGVEQLLAVLPLVDGLGLVETLVALEAEQLPPRGCGERHRQLGLADAGRSLDEQRLLQPLGQEDRRGDLPRREVPLPLQQPRCLLYRREHLPMQSHARFPRHPSRARLPSWNRPRAPSARRCSTPSCNWP
jgi:hypothetical protein